MITPYKNRSIDCWEPVEVYRNLIKSCYSIRQNGKVVGHADSVCLKDCFFMVNQNGRKRVVETGRKNVHAYISGFISNFSIDKPSKVWYNPLITSQFRIKDAAIFAASRVELNKFGVFV